MSKRQSTKAPTREALQSRIEWHRDARVHAAELAIRNAGTDMDPLSIVTSAKVFYEFLINEDVN